MPLTDDTMTGSESDEDTVYHRLDTSVNLGKSEDENSLVVVIPLPELCVIPTERKYNLVGHPISCGTLLMDSSFDSVLVFSSQSKEIDDKTSEHFLSNSDMDIDEDEMPASFSFVDWTCSDSITSDGSGNASESSTVDQILSSFDDTDSGTLTTEKKRSTCNSINICEEDVPNSVFYHKITAGASADAGFSIVEIQPSLSLTPTSFAASIVRTRSKILNKRALNASIEGVRYEPYIYSVAGVSLISFGERTRLNDPILLEPSMNCAGGKVAHGTNVLRNNIRGDSKFWAVSEEGNTIASSDDVTLGVILQDRIKLIARIKEIKADIALHSDDFSYNCSPESSEETDVVTHPDACTSFQKLSILPRTGYSVLDKTLSSTIPCRAGQVSNTISLSGGRADNRELDLETEQVEKLVKYLSCSVHVHRECTETEYEEKSDDGRGILMSDETNDGESDTELCRRDCRRHGYGTVNVTNLLHVSSIQRSDDGKNKISDGIGDASGEKDVDDGSSVVLSRSGSSLSSMYDISWMKLPSPLLRPRPLPRSDDADTRIFGTERYHVADYVIDGTDNIANKSDSRAAVIGISDNLGSTDSYEQHSSFVESAPLCGKFVDNFDGSVILKTKEIQEISVIKNVNMKGDGSRSNISNNRSILGASDTFPNLSELGSIVTKTVNPYLSNFFENQPIPKEISKKIVKKNENRFKSPRDNDQMDAGCSSPFSANLHIDTAICDNFDYDNIQYSRSFACTVDHAISHMSNHRNTDMVYLSTAQVSPSLRTDKSIISNSNNSNTAFDLRINFKTTSELHSCEKFQPSEVVKEKDYAIRGDDEQNIKNKAKGMRKGIEKYSFSRHAVRDVPFICPFPVLKSPIRPLSKYSSSSSSPKQSQSSPSERNTLSSSDDAMMVPPFPSPLHSTSSSSPSNIEEATPSHHTLPLPLLIER